MLSVEQETLPAEIRQTKYLKQSSQPIGSLNIYILLADTDPVFINVLLCQTKYLHTMTVSGFQVMPLAMWGAQGQELKAKECSPSCNRPSGVIFMLLCSQCPHGHTYKVEIFSLAHVYWIFHCSS